MAVMEPCAVQSLDLLREVADTSILRTGHLAPIVAFGLGCVKTCAREKGAELFSLLSSLDSGGQRFCFSN
jgi:hypothetical protein